MKPTQRRTAAVNVRVTPAEHEEIRVAAEASGVGNMASWVRQVLLAAARKFRQPRK